MELRRRMSLVRLYAIKRKVFELVSAKRVPIFKVSVENVGCASMLVAISSSQEEQRGSRSNAARLSWGNKRDGKREVHMASGGKLKV
jgi:hypothetical protein